MTVLIVGHVIKSTKTLVKGTLVKKYQAMMELAKIGKFSFFAEFSKNDTRRLLFIQHFIELSLRKKYRPFVGYLRPKHILDLKNSVFISASEYTIVLILLYVFLEKQDFFPNTSLYI